VRRIFFRTLGRAGLAIEDTRCRTSGVEPSRLSRYDGDGATDSLIRDSERGIELSENFVIAS